MTIYLFTGHNVRQGGRRTQLDEDKEGVLGVDNITTEDLQAAPEALDVNVLRILFQTIWMEEKIPDD